MRSSPSCCSSSLPTSNSPHDPPTVRLETSYHRTIRGTPSAPGAAVENCGGTRASVDTVAPHAEVESHKISHAFSINALLFAHTNTFLFTGGGASSRSVLSGRSYSLGSGARQSHLRAQRHQISAVLSSPRHLATRERRPDRRRRAPAPGRSQSRNPHGPSAMTILPCALSADGDERAVMQTRSFLDRAPPTGFVLDSG